MIILSRAALAAGLFVISGSAVLAHASISPKEAANGSSIKLAVTVPHGCDAAPTDTVIIKLPEGFVSAKPQVKAGWTVEITKGDYQQAYEVHGSPVKSGALEVKWSGGSVPDDQFDEFVVQGTLLGFAGETSLPIIVTQLCGTASVVWDEIAAEGQDAHALKRPAPTLKVTVAAVADAHDHMMAMPAGPVVLGELEISGGFARATLPNAPVAGGFLSIVNTGAVDDRLVSATTTVSGVTQIHEMKMEGDVMKMAELPDGLPIPAGETVTLQPGGFHLMFMELKEPLVEGTRVPVTLTFEKAGTVEIMLDVGGIGAKVAPMPMMQHG
jgi:hypothetical protein